MLSPPFKLRCLLHLCYVVICICVVFYSLFMTLYFCALHTAHCVVSFTCFKLNPVTFSIFTSMYNTCLKKKKSLYVLNTICRHSNLYHFSVLFGMISLRELKEKATHGSYAGARTGGPWLTDQPAFSQLFPWRPIKMSRPANGTMITVVPMLLEYVQEVSGSACFFISTHGLIKKYSRHNPFPVQHYAVSQHPHGIDR